MYFKYLRIFLGESLVYLCKWFTAGTAMQKIASCLEVLDGFLRQSYPVVGSLVVEERHEQIDRPATVEDCVGRIMGMLKILP
jgi:hypothetical protein